MTGIEQPVPHPAAAPLTRLARALPFGRIVVIFNPNSTGDSPDNARTLVADLSRERPDLPVELLETEHAGDVTRLDVLSVQVDEGPPRYAHSYIGLGLSPIKVDSLVFANIDRMAKYVNLSETGTPDDGRFEVVLVAHRSRPTLLADVLRAVTGHLQPRSRTQPYRFTALTAMPLQLDGEVVDLPNRAHVPISCHPHALPCVP